MRLLVSSIPFDGGKSGISVYCREVVRALAAAGHSVVLLLEPGADDPSFAGLERVHAPSWTRPAPLSMFWHLVFLPFWIRARRRDFDAFVICAANRRVCAWYPLPTVATVHDLANFHVKGKYSRSRMFYLAHVLPFFAKKAQHLVAVSRATKSDMVEYWHCRPEDVAVLYNGLGPETGNLESAPGVRGRNILYISRIEHPGKNHLRLIEAYGKLPPELAAAHPLVLAGADWKDAGAVHAAAEASPNAAHIRFTGFVEDIEPLWREAGFYVFPSLFEGFGLSLAEAMARGIPCAASGNGSLGEIAETVAVTFDPSSVDGIAAALTELLTESESDRAARIARGIERAKRFSWKDHADGIAALAARTGGAVDMFGIKVAKMTLGDAVEHIVATVKTRRNSSPRRPYFISTLNVDFVANAVSGKPFGGNAELWGYLKKADLTTADGMPLVLLSKLLGNPLPERVTGADIVPALCRRFSEEGLSVYVLGGDAETVKKAFSGLPPVRVAGIDPAFVKLDEPQDAIVDRINAAKPDILFVALGNPKQELWMGRNAAKLDVPAMIGVGGTFNFLAGRVKRAPRWMQRSGLEWIYRISQEPGRLWKRYAYGLVKFSWLSILALAGAYKDAGKDGECK